MIRAIKMRHAAKRGKRGSRVADNPAKFTRQDFQFIADVIKELHLQPYGVDRGVVRTVALAFADALRSTNPNFNKTRFLHAALGTGYETNPRRARKNPPIVTFGNPVETLSRDAVKIYYKHAGDGQYYQHAFKRGQVHIKGNKTSKIAILERVDGKPILGEY